MLKKKTLIGTSMYLYLRYFYDYHKKYIYISCYFFMINFSFIIIVECVVKKGERHQ